MKPGPDRNARRFFLDIEAHGNVILSAPKRTAFDHGSEFPVICGDSGDAQFIAEFNFGGRTWTVTVDSWPELKRPE